MLKHLLLIVTFFLTVIGCYQSNNKTRVEKAISDLTNKFHQLPKGKGEQSDYYKLVRSVFIGGKNIEFQLRSSPDTLNDPQRIIIAINSENEIYAIPLFSNTYHDFWNFQFDSVLTYVNPTNTTFEREFKICLETLNLTDTLGTAGIVINELLVSLLQCERLTEGDSSLLNAPSIVTNPILKEENNDSCAIRLHKNWQAIINGFRPREYILSYNAYWDKHSNRIYQINSNNTSDWKKLNLHIKTYRQDCIWILMSL